MSSRDDLWPCMILERGLVAVSLETISRFSVLGGTCLGTGNWQLTTENGVHMEALNRMVADSLARHGFEVPVSTHRVDWSRWFRCESSFSLLLVPSAPGIYALGEEVVAPSEIRGGKRMLAVFEVAETEDLCVALSRKFAPRDPLSARLSGGRCFLRFAQIADAEQRHATCAALTRWLATTSEAAAGVVANSVTKDFGSARDVTAAPSPSDTTDGKQAKQGTPQNEPPPFPAGF